MWNPIYVIQIPPANFYFTEIINKYRIKIAKHEEDINDILKQEKEEKEVIASATVFWIITIYGLASSGRDGNEQGTQSHRTSWRDP